MSFNLDSGFVYVIVFWCIIFLVNSYLKASRSHGLYYNDLLVSHGLSLSLCQIRWQTVLLNKFFSKIGRCYPRFLLLWFNLGAAFTVIAMATSLVLLSTMLYKTFRETKSEKILQPVMPGMNLPWDQLWYYVITLIISGTFHEVGHAVAAVRENVRVISFGVFILFLYPGAFVELHTDQLDIITPVRRLRIYGAGVWHNFVLALMAYLFSYSMPVLLTPFYETGEGALVTWISPKVSISSRLPHGDVLLSLNDCPLHKVEDYYSCLQRIATEPVEGYCNSLNYVKTHNISLPSLVTSKFGELDCCNDTTSYRFCFWYQLKNKPRSFVKKRLNRNTRMKESSEYNSKFTEHACLPGRQTISVDTTCSSNIQCPKDLQNRRPLCLKPLIYNKTRVVRIKHKKGKQVLFVGDPRELSTSVLLSNHIPKYNIPFLRLPDHLQAILLYLISISSALALLNMVPCLYLDGHHTLGIMTEMLFPNHPVFRSKLNSIVLTFGSMLLLINVGIALSGMVLG